MTVLNLTRPAARPNRHSANSAAPNTLAIIIAVQVSALQQVRAHSRGIGAMLFIIDAFAKHSLIDEFNAIARLEDQRKDTLSTS